MSTRFDAALAELSAAVFSDHINTITALEAVVRTLQALRDEFNEPDHAEPGPANSEQAPSE